MTMPNVFQSANELVTPHIIIIIITIIVLYCIVLYCICYCD